MKKRTFFTLGACALASLAMIGIKNGFKRLKRDNFADAGLFV